MRRGTIFLGRFFIGSLFVFSGVSKIFSWEGAQSGFMSILADWHALSFPFFQNLMQSLIPWAPAILTVVTAIEVIGGVFLILGVRARFFAFLLIMTLIPMTILLHSFWFFEGSRGEMQLILFMKNIGILGGLLYILSFGARESKPSGGSPNR